MMPLLLLLLRLLLFCYFYISPPHSPSPFFLSCCPSVRILWPGAMMAGGETTQPRKTRGGKPPGIDVMVMPVLGETLFLASSPLRNRRGRIEPKNSAIFQLRNVSHILELEEMPVFSETFRGKFANCKHLGFVCGKHRTPSSSFPIIGTIIFLRSTHSEKKISRACVPYMQVQ